MNRVAAGLITYLELAEEEKVRASGMAWHGMAAELCPLVKKEMKEIYLDGTSQESPCGAHRGQTAVFHSLSRVGS